MTLAGLAWRSVRHFWRASAAVVAGIAIAVAVLTGALLVGVSVRASLRDLALSRLGRVDTVLQSTGFVRDSLGSALAASADAAISEQAPLISLEGAVTHEASGRVAHRVAVYGVDDRFWKLQGLSGIEGPAGRDAFVSAALANELGAAEKDALRLTVQRTPDIPAGVLHGRRDQLARSIRLNVAARLDLDRGGDFSLRPGQADVRALFVPLARLQRDLTRERQVNLIALGPATPRSGAASVSGVDVPRLAAAIRATVDLADVGLRLRRAETALIVESSTGFLSDAQERAIEQTAATSNWRTEGVLTYLVNDIRIGDRSIPYSTVAAIGDSVSTPSTQADGSNRIDLNQWAASELQARPGDAVTLDFYTWSDEQGLATRSAELTFGDVVPMEGRGADGTLTPDYPGLTDEARMGEWDPPFPVDLARIRPQDEAYWSTYRAAPKAFVSLEAGQRLWASRFGRLTSIRIAAPPGGWNDELVGRAERSMLSLVDPVRDGLIAVLPLRDQALAAASGTTDFGLYFVYFSFFLVVAALLLAATFFILGVEQRLREIGLLRAIGFEDAPVRRLLLSEGMALAAAGTVLGLMLAVGYGWLMMVGLRTWWVGAVGTSRLTLHVEPGPFIFGALAGLLIAPLVVLLSMRRLKKISARRLLADGGRTLASQSPRAARLRAKLVTRAAAAAAAALLALRWVGLTSDTAAFFGAGGLLLVAGISAFFMWLLASPSTPLAPHGTRSVASFGMRLAADRPGRAALSVALLALATFTIVAVGAFRRDGPPDTARDSGTGGYALMAESAAPLVDDPGTADGRARLGLTGFNADGVSIARFRLREGDDGSCLNLYQPAMPRLIGATPAFVDERRFAFSATLAANDTERNNPWLLLSRRFDDGAIPAIGDATSLTYVLHKAVGDEIVVPSAGGEEIRLRIVASLRDSVLQSSLVLSEADFMRVYPRTDGYRVFLVDTGAQPPADVAARLESSLTDVGFDAERTADRLAGYHRVENTYLSTFQVLGGLGLILGTLGVGALLLRNVLERQREMAVLAAVGYSAGNLSLMVLAETAMLVATGVGLGSVCALVSIAPAIFGRGQPLPVTLLLATIVGVALAALLSSLAATHVVRRLPLVRTLRAE